MECLVSSSREGAFWEKLRRIADEIVNPYWASLQLDEKPADKS